MINWATRSGSWVHFEINNTPSSEPSEFRNVSRQCDVTKLRLVKSRDLTGLTRAPRHWPFLKSQFQVRQVRTSQVRSPPVIYTVLKYNEISNTLPLFVFM